MTQSHCYKTSTVPAMLATILTFYWRQGEFKGPALREGQQSRGAGLPTESAGHCVAEGIAAKVLGRVPAERTVPSGNFEC